MKVRWGRGRHRRQVRRDRRAVAGLLALVAAGGVAAAVALSASPGRTGPGPAPAASGAPAAAPEPVSAASPLQACAATVAAGRAAIAAARPARDHWAEHVQAQLDYDAGTATLARTRERWAASKATAEADLAGFATAHAAFGAVRDGCGPADAAVRAVSRPVAEGQPDADATLARCRDELGPVVAAEDAAKAVVDDWAAHVAMMKDKAHIDPRQYGHMWHEMVAAAPADLDRFATATRAADQHSGCPAPR